jgi:hypothetical protein
LSQVCEFIAIQRAVGICQIRPEKRCSAEFVRKNMIQDSPEYIAQLTEHLREYEGLNRLVPHNALYLEDSKERNRLRGRDVPVEISNSDILVTGLTCVGATSTA